jgi:hypothetical protein
MGMDTQPDLPLKPSRVRASYLAMHPATIAKTFTDFVMALREVIVLDGMEVVPKNIKTSAPMFSFRERMVHPLLPLSGGSSE